MTTTTADRFLAFDPAQSFEFKAFLFLDRVVSTVKIRALIELARLSFLGFFDRFESFVDNLQLAEDEATTEEKIRDILEQKIKLAQGIDRILKSLESMESIRFRNSTLAAYVAGNERIQTLKGFASTARLERAIEAQIEQAKQDFLSTFARRKLTKEQRTLLVEKFRKITISN